MLELTDKNFEKEVLDSDLPVLVDFFALWCAPCKMATPVIEELAKEYEGKIKIGKLNVDESPKMAQKYEVMSIPTVILFRNGKEIRRKMGFPGKKEYEDLINQILNSKS